MDKLLVAKIAFEAVRARDNGHATKGGTPDWFNVSEGVHKNWLAMVESGKTEDELVQAVLDCHGIMPSRVKAAAPAPAPKAAPAKKAKKKKAKKKGR